MNRIERDSLGEIEVPTDCYWGAQTQRSLRYFKIGQEKMPEEMIHALAMIKKAAAIVNHRLGKLESHKKEAIVRACDEIMEGKWADQFPLSVWQTGSGTQTNMNLNEVIANRATQILGGDFAKEKKVHPNDEVNLSQSSNDVFPSAMHLSSVSMLERKLLPSLERLRESLHEKTGEFNEIVKIGRTHLQDATPLTLGQEFSAYEAMLEENRLHLRGAIEFLRPLPIGGTAVGTGLNAPEGFDECVVKTIGEMAGTRFSVSPNKFHGLTSHDALVFASGALHSLAANLMKMANDIRWLASGPRCGIGEITIPANEPGSSIMPGKVNPTQCEAVTMVACQVFGNHSTIGFSASQGNFELNVFKPVIIFNFLQSTQLLSDAMTSFAEHCVAGITPVQKKIDQYLHSSLMLVTALVPSIGYDNAAKIAQKAHEEEISLKQAALELGILEEMEFDACFLSAFPKKGEKI